MPYTCRAVDTEYLDAAPYRYINEVQINATPEQVFQVFADEKSWPKWFKGILNVKWTTSEPHGVGSVRIVQLGPIAATEKFTIWEPGKRFTFHIAATNLPVLHTFYEDYRLEDLGDQKTKLIYTVAFEPRLLGRIGGPLTRWILGKLLQNAVHSLATYMK